MEKEIDEKKQGQSLVLDQKEGNTKKLFIESYGCQMNFSDSEIVAWILYENGYTSTQKFENADQFYKFILDEHSSYKQAQQVMGFGCNLRGALSP